MENNVKFTLAIDTINKKIAELNIKLSKDLNNEILKSELAVLIQDRDKLFKGKDIEDLEKLFEKYGSNK